MGRPRKVVELSLHSDQTDRDASSLARHRHMFRGMHILDTHANIFCQFTSGYHPNGIREDNTEHLYDFGE
jgi:hypothetical protein